MGKLLWQPTQEQIEQSNMYRYMQVVNQRYDQRFESYDDLYRWSVEAIPDFWASIWDFMAVRASQPYDRVLDDVTKMPGARWFEGARLNFAENLLRYRDDRTAIIFKGESQPALRMTYAELYTAVSRVASAMRECGVAVGDRVVGFMPNMPHAIIAMLAATSLGATWSSCSPDFGIKGVLDRFGQIKPKVLFTANGYSFKGKSIDCLARIRQILQQLPSIERVVVVPYTEPAPDIRDGSQCRHLRCVYRGASRRDYRLCTTALRSSPLHHVLLGHHGAAQMHGAECRRDSAAPDEGTGAAHRPHAGGYDFLFHHLRVDDVELADLFPGYRGGAGAF